MVEQLQAYFPGEGQRDDIVQALNQSNGDTDKALEIMLAKNYSQSSRAVKTNLQENQALYNQQVSQPRQSINAGPPSRPPTSKPKKQRRGQFNSGVNQPMASSSQPSSVNASPSRSNQSPSQ